MIDAAPRGNDAWRRLVGTGASHSDVVRVMIGVVFVDELDGMSNPVLQEVLTCIILFEPQ
jgi:hypothetical protein